MHFSLRKTSAIGFDHKELGVDDVRISPVSVACYWLNKSLGCEISRSYPQPCSADIRCRVILQVESRRPAHATLQAAATVRPA